MLTILRIDDLEKENCFHSHNTRETACKIHPGHVGLLMTAKEQLTSFVFKLGEQGIQCTNRMRRREVLHVVPTF